MCKYAVKVQEGGGENRCPLFRLQLFIITSLRAGATQTGAPTYGLKEWFWHKTGPLGSDKEGKRGVSVKQGTGICDQGLGCSLHFLPLFKRIPPQSHNKLTPTPLGRSAGPVPRPQSACLPYSSPRKSSVSWSRISLNSKFLRLLWLALSVLHRTVKLPFGFIFQQVQVNYLMVLFST